MNNSILIKDIEDKRTLFAVKKLCKLVIYLDGHISSSDEEFEYKLSKARNTYKNDVDFLSQINFGKQSIANLDGTTTVIEEKTYSGTLSLDHFLLSLSDFYDFVRDGFADFEEENDFIIYYEFLKKIKDKNIVDISYFWNYIDQDIRDKFKWNFFSNMKDAVFNLTVFLEELIRNKVKKETSEELTGVSLMRKAFSPTNPIIKVVPDLDNQINRDIQEGTMNLAVSIMQKIKNPKSHSFVHTEKDEVFIGYIFTCDSLYRKIKDHL